MVELPPRARRILFPTQAPTRSSGTTSACAENTGLHPCPCKRARNYLRVRGEYLVGRVHHTCDGELPPRARRIREFQQLSSLSLGTTSACAENTCFVFCQVFVTRNYLRVRGEYPHSVSNQAPPGELPPRARRILVSKQANIGVSGTTSACAENTRQCGSGCV